MVIFDITLTGTHIQVQAPVADKTHPRPVIAQPGNKYGPLQTLEALLNWYAPEDAEPEEVNLPTVKGAIVWQIGDDGSLTYYTPYHTDNGQGPNTCTGYMSMGAALGLCAALRDALGAAQISAPGAEQENGHELSGGQPNGRTVRGGKP